jgi:hypothetical protein
MPKRLDAVLPHFAVEAPEAEVVLPQPEPVG